MDKIEVRILNPQGIADAEDMMLAAARLTQRGHKIKNMDDFMNLYRRPDSDNLSQHLISLPHPTLQKFGVINVVITGGSRRFLAQITRHQNEVKFMSASLQYSDYSEQSDFCIPYEILEKGENAKNMYIEGCKKAMRKYATLATMCGNDAAGYCAPQGMRNILIISATPYQWIHMIRQRTCKRNTLETRYIMLLIWSKLYDISDWFKNCGPFCMNGGCKEGVMGCKELIKAKSPREIIAEDFPLLSK